MAAAEFTRYVITDPPFYTLGGRRKDSDGEVGDVFLVLVGRKPDEEGDYMGRIERTGQVTDISATALMLEADLAPAIEELALAEACTCEEFVAVDAVRSAYLDLVGASALEAETLVALALYRSR